MAIDIQAPATTAVRTTSPLCGSDPFTMTIDVPCYPTGRATYRVPGVQVQGGDPRFVEGFGTGRDCYFDEVDDLLNADGTPHHGSFTWEQWTAGAVQMRQVRDLTPDDLLHFLIEMLSTSEQGISQVEQIGYLTGYLVTCIENYYQLACLECGSAPGLCTHPQPDPATRSQAHPSEWFTATVKAHDHSGEERRVLFPGVLSSGADPAFIDFFSWGRESYLNEVHTLVWPNGREVEFLPPPEQRSQLRVVKDHDLTTAALIEEFTLALKDQAAGEVSPLENAGYFFGYLAACVEEFYGLNCDACGNTRGLCEHM